MAELNRKDLIEESAIQAPLDLADNFDKVAKSLMAVINNGKKLNDALGSAKSVKEVSTSTKSLAKNQSELEKVEKRLLTAQQKNNKEYIQKASELKRVQQETRDAIKTEGQLSSTYDSQSTRLKNLRKEYKDAVLMKGRDAKETQRLAKRVEVLDKRLKEVDESAGQFNRNVGNYKSALEDTNGALGNFTEGLKASAKALLANPIGLVVAALTALVAVFKRSQEGIDLFERGFNFINSIINTVADNLGALGSIIANFFTGNFAEATAQAKAFGNELVENAKATDELTIAQQKLERRIIKNQALNAKALAEEEELKNVRDNELNSIEERTEANDKLFTVESKRFERNISIAEEQLRIAREEAKLRDDNVEALRAVSEAEARLFELREEKAGRENEFITNRTGLIREASEDEVAVVEANINKRLLLVEEGSREELNLRLKLIDQREKLELQAVGDNVNRQNAIVQNALNERMQLYKDYQSNITQLEKINTDIVTTEELEKEFALVNRVDKEIKAIAARYQKEREEAERTAEAVRMAEENKRRAYEEAAFVGIDVANQLFSNQVSNIQNELELLRESTDRKLELAEGNEEGQELIRERAAERERELRREQAEAERRQALFNILVSTGIGIMRAVQQFGLPAAIPFIIATSALGAAQAAALPPVPQFAEGTESSPEGHAIINEEGVELLERNGKYSMVESEGATLTYLQRGTKVHTAKETQELLASGALNNVSINDRPYKNPMDAKIYSELKNISKGVNSVKAYNSYLDGQKISSNIRQRNAIRNRVKNMNRY